MAINRDYLGRAYELPEPYEVTRVKIREFADAISTRNPLYRDPATPKKPVHRRHRASHLPHHPEHGRCGQAIADPELALTSPVVHGDQRSRYSRPSRPGTW